MAQLAQPKSSARNQNPRRLVATPGGFRDSSLVQSVSPQQSILKSGRASRLLDFTTGIFIEDHEDGIFYSSEETRGGWKTWASWGNKTGEPIDSFSTRWIVPAEPAKPANQLVYLFSGLQNQNGTEILQPVLQWGISGAGGGPFWSIASWHADEQGRAFCTSSIRVAPGDELIGVITRTAEAPQGTHNYKCEFRGVPATALLAIAAPEMVTAIQTLEAYGVRELENYPNTDATEMVDIRICSASGAPALSWIPHTDGAEFGERTAIGKNDNPGGEIKVFY